MTIEKKETDGELMFILTGRMDTITAPSLEKELEKSIEGVERLVLDFTKLEYISSAGLRVLLMAQKIMNKRGEMIVRNVNEIISEVFEATGFVDILTIE